MITAPIPLPLTGMDSFQKGFGYNDNLMQQIIQRKQLAQQQQQHKDSLAIQQQQQARLGQMMPLQVQAYQDAHAKALMETDPAKKMAYVNALMEGINQMGSQGGQQAPQEQPMTPFSGQGMPSQGEMDNPTAPQMPQGQSGGLNFTPQQQMAMGLAGIKVPTIKENPQQKRYAELQDKIFLEQVKQQQKIAFAQTQADLANAKTHFKTIEDARNDLPHLEKTLRALEKMKDIAANPANSDLFGHYIEGDKIAAMRSSNPEAGDWQIYGLDPIIDAESKMSVKGNQLALKTSLGMKPNFAENQKVALRKIEASIDNIKYAMKQTQKIANEGKEESNGFALMRDTEGTVWKVPAKDVEARTAEKWQHVE